MKFWNIYLFFSICYYYYHYYFIASRRWFFLTYTYTNFGLSNLEFFIESLSVSNMFTVFFSFLFLFFHFLYICFYYYYYYYCLCLCVLYVYKPCWETNKISSRFESCFVFYFRIFHFCIAELWILVKYTETKNKKKKRILKAHYWWSVQLQTTQFLVLQRDCKNQVIEKIGTARGPRALL